MRASRLLSLLLLLQTHGRLTAQELADSTEVSVRTIYRDMDALTAAGVPVYADRGPDGGYSLPEGYRTQLTGMSAEEADALAVSGMPGAAAELGLGRVLAAAQRKVSPAPPSELSSRAGRIAERFHLDAPGWFREADHVPTLTGVADAVWNQRVVRIRYRRWGDEESTREVEPLGLVLKAGTWYLVAGTHGAMGAPRTYRVARVQSLETLDVRFDRPAYFDLWRYWNTPPDTPTVAPPGTPVPALYQAEASVRVSPAGMALAPDVLRPHTARALTEVAWPTDADGWTRATIPVESFTHARTELLALGADVEVVSPRALREQMRDAARSLASLYGG